MCGRKYWLHLRGIIIILKRIKIDFIYNFRNKDIKCGYIWSFFYFLGTFLMEIHELSVVFGNTMKGIIDRNVLDFNFDE